MRVLSVLLAVLLLAACAKKGPPKPPGPDEAITYPKSYPSR
jgi:predicted small lipoprotein YifL